MHISNDTLHIAVADSSLIVRSGVIATLKSLIDAKLHIVEITTAEELADCMQMHSPDMLIVNPSLLRGLLPEDGCREAIDRFKKNFSSVIYIALITSLSELPMTNGYDGVISIYDTSETIAATIGKILDKGNPAAGLEIEGENMEHASVAEGANATFNLQPDDSAASILSQREKEIVVCVVGGLTNKEIADRLFLSVHTVITHRKNISRKLQIHSVAALTIYAIANRLIDIEDLN